MTLPPFHSINLTMLGIFLITFLYKKKLFLKDVYTSTVERSKWILDLVMRSLINHLIFTRWSIITWNKGAYFSSDLILSGVAFIRVCTLTFLCPVILTCFGQWEMSKTYLASLQQDGSTEKWSAFGEINFATETHNCLPFFCHRILPQKLTIVFFI